MIPSTSSSPPSLLSSTPFFPSSFPVTNSSTSSLSSSPSLSSSSSTTSTIVHGIISPLSNAYPNENDLENNESLISYLTNNNVFETPMGQEYRDQILQNLLILARDWVTLVGRARGCDESICRNGGGVTLKIFGSQKLRVHSPEADMDILCVAPSFVSRYDFFTSFCQMLESLEGVTLLLPIPEAYTPVVKFNVGNQPVDMIFVSLPIITIPPNINFQDNHLLLGLDEQGVRSLNGYRVAERLLELVPNVDNFCVTLAAIKHWAKRRGIYANILGFLGGVNFAILVAHVCQMHINSCPATLVKEFFKLYNQWKWPNGILLTYIEDLPHMDGTYFPSWNSKVYPGDKMHLMPIITPTAPAMNSAYNVGEPQKFMIVREFQRGNNLFVSWRSHCDELGRFETFNWEELFVSSDIEFFQQYKHYIQIDVSADTPPEHRRWFGWCESRLRQLIIALHQPDIMSSHPYSNCYHRRISKSTGFEITQPSVPIHSPGTLSNTLVREIPIFNEPVGNNNNDIMFCSSFFIGLSFHEYTPKIDLTPIIQNFLYRVCSWNGRTPCMEIEIKVRTKTTLPPFIFENIALPSSTAGCTPSKNKLRSDSTTIPPNGVGLLSQEESSERNYLTPSILSLSDRLHVTFANNNNHSDLSSVNGTPIASRSATHPSQDLDISNLSHAENGDDPENEDEDEDNNPENHNHIAKTIFHDDDCESNNEEERMSQQSQQQSNQQHHQHQRRTETKTEFQTTLSSPSGRIKKHNNIMKISVEEQQDEHPPTSNLSSPCKRSRSS